MAQASTMKVAGEVRFNRFMALVYLVMAIGLGLFIKRDLSGAGQFLLILRRAGR